MSNQHGYKCPSCKSDEDIIIQALIWTHVVPDGTDEDSEAVHDYSRYWDETHNAHCSACGWDGKVAAL
jgi:hypothetical protein